MKRASPDDGDTVTEKFKPCTDIAFDIDISGNRAEEAETACDAIGEQRAALFGQLTADPCKILSRTRVYIVNSFGERVKPEFDMVERIGSLLVAADLMGDKRRQTKLGEAVKAL